jgi:hypothetical protein
VRNFLKLTLLGALLLPLAATPAANAAAVPGVGYAVVTAPTTAVLGGSFAATTKISNGKAKKSAAGVLRIYLWNVASDARGDLIGQAKVPALKAKKRLNVKITGTVPSGLAEGSYKILAALDTKKTKCSSAKPCPRKGTKFGATAVAVKATLSDGTVPGVKLPNGTPIPGAPLSPNGLPTANPDSYSVDEDTQLTVTAASGLLGNDSDPDGNSIYAVLNSPAPHGQVVVFPSGAFTYRGAGNFSGQDSFTYKVNDGKGYSPVVTVSITVKPINDRPTAVADGYTTAEDVPLVVAAPGLMANDVDADGDTLTPSVTDPPLHGTLTILPTGGFTYTPAANYAGLDKFAYKLSDGTVDSIPTDVSLKITAVNDPPTAVADPLYTVGKNKPLTVPTGSGILINDTDPDGDILTVATVNGATPSATTAIQTAHGSVKVNGNGSFVYTPALDFRGVDSFSYVAGDGPNVSGSATVTIKVGKATTAVADVYNVPIRSNPYYSTVSLLANDSPKGDGTGETVEIIEYPNTGAVFKVYADGNFMYQPISPDYVGEPDLFKYRIVDAEGFASEVVTVTINLRSDLEP